MVVPFLKCISKAVWAAIYPKSQTCPSEGLIKSMHILICLIFWLLRDLSVVDEGSRNYFLWICSLWYFWIIFKTRTSQLKKKGSLNKSLINVSHCYRGTKGFKVSETCWDICAQFLYTMQKVQNIMGNLILKGCQSRSMLWRVSYGSDQFIKKASELF